MNALAMQIAFTLPLSLPLVAAAATYRLDWFYPAFMIALGTHYLPFIFLYGMWQFGALAALLIGGGMRSACSSRSPFSSGAWVTALAPRRLRVRREERCPPLASPIVSW
jgi:hypothetical protein